jgi:transmembrane 9 superfamily protein 2/4
MTTSTTSKIVLAVSGIFVLFLIVVSVVSIYREGALFIPGLAPTAYKEGQPVILYVNKVTSDHQPIPFSYHSLPVCLPDPKLVQEYRKTENLGALITGNTVEPSAFQLKFMEPVQTCAALCEKTYGVDEMIKMKSLLAAEYRVHWQVDDLPAVFRWKLHNDYHYSNGFALGQKDGVLNNHFAMTIYYNTNKMPSTDKDKPESNIVSFFVEPKSFAYSNRDKACDEIDKVGSLALDKVNQTVVFTYSVQWELDSKTEWTNRWKHYKSNEKTGQIHWFAIINSLMVIFVLSGMVAVILTKTLRRDFLKIEEDNEQMTTETGWKTLNADVFRAPRFPIVLSVLVGSGVQVLLMCVVTLVFSVLGFLSPANQGSLMTAALVLYVWMGMAAGYSSARIYQVFQGENTTRNTLMTATLFPGILYAVASILNIPLAVQGSSGAFPFTTSLAVFALWVFISIPLCYLGSRFARSQDPISLPGTVNLIPRPIPEQRWYMHPVLCVLMSGLLPFGAVFIELFFIMSSIWKNQFYFLFGFLFLVFLIMLITCAEISVVMCYFQLSNMDWQWWWRAYLSSGSSAFYMFLYAIHYYIFRLQIEGGVSTFLYFGYSLLLCLGFFVLTGTIGFIACFIFVRRIYKAIHQD